MNEPKISVIVPVYKVEPYLRKCVDSIINQTYQNLEIILVDDGSPDNCGAICDEYAAKDSRVRVIHKQNGGVSSARNAGLDACTGDYIGFVDSDDWIEPEMYEELMSALQRNNADISTCFAAIVSADCSDKKYFPIEFNRARITSEEFLKSILQPIRKERNVHISAGIHTKLYKKEIWDTIRFNNYKTGEDVDVIVKVALCFQTCAICNKPYYNYYTRETSAIHTTGYLEISKSAYELAKSIVQYGAQSAIVAEYGVDRVIRKFFVYANYIAAINDRELFFQARNDFMIYLPKIKSHFGTYAVKYQIGLLFIIFTPKIFWSIVKIKNKNLKVKL